ncbi:hypothetical protein AB0J72_34430 [Dactylosporangium sp. NPDC049742]|uniref:hypothetical protein n=1 Tax=Dactylosporangium sp. NPDC049742 TaxID=3154737 RepID=UPI003428B971
MKRRITKVVAACAATLATAALGIVAVPTAAHASPATALQRCLSAGVPNVDVTITHPGNVSSVGYPNVANQWNVIYPGDVINIISGGSVRYDFWGASTGPAGLSGQYGDASFPFPGYPKVASVIRFNNNPAGWVGNPDLTVNWGGCHQWTSPYPVRVGFYVNDNNLGDNGGAWSYRILHYYP